VLNESYVCVRVCVHALTGAEKWDRTEPESEHSHVNVSGLTHGQTYELRVVALGHHGNHNTSKAEKVYVGFRPRE